MLKVSTQTKEVKRRRKGEGRERRSTKGGSILKVTFLKTYEIGSFTNERWPYYP